MAWLPCNLQTVRKLLQESIKSMTLHSEAEAGISAYAFVEPCAKARNLLRCSLREPRGGQEYGRSNSASP
jgi:hypothetical protein